MTTTVKSNLLKMATDVKPEMDIAVDKLSQWIVKSAQLVVPVDTHALQQSIYAVTPISDGYSASLSTAEALRPEVTFFDKVEPVVVAGQANAAISVSAPYGVDIELGDTHGNARPYFIPAVYDAAKQIETLVASALLRAERKNIV
jgi:hypothetical protein